MVKAKRPKAHLRILYVRTWNEWRLVLCVPSCGEWVVRQSENHAQLFKFAERFRSETGLPLHRYRGITRKAGVK